MRTFESLRNFGFWTFDKFCRGLIVEHYQELHTELSGLSDPEKKKEKKWRSILNHAATTTAFYKRYRQADSIYNLPVINRSMISDYYEELRSEMYIDRKVRYGVTSGSTGSPFCCPMSESKWARRTAEVIYYNELAGFTVGIKHLLISNRKKSWLKRFLQNAVILDSRIIDEKWLANARFVLLKENKIKVLIGILSTVELLASYCNSCNDDPGLFKLDCIILIGEPLEADRREKIEKAFACKAHSRYAAEELGVIAQTCSNGSDLHINTSSYMVEMLSLSSNEPVRYGEPGRIVITDYNSFAMPLIRYDIGDVAVLEEKCSCCTSSPVFKYIEGRTVDIICNTSGKSVSPFSINRLFKGIEGIRQFQFIQEGEGEYEIIIAASSEYHRFTVEPQLNEALYNLLGFNAMINYKYLDIIKESENGKRHYIINKFNRTNKRVNQI